LDFKAGGLAQMQVSFKKKKVVLDFWISDVGFSYKGVQLVRALQIFQILNNPQSWSQAFRVRGNQLEFTD
jgi:hypothetical protein